jgi:hypothetical protein
MSSVKMFRGDTWKRSWIIGGLENPVNLEGASARLHLRDAKGILKVEATIGNGRISITPATGRIDLRVEGADMILDPNDSYSFDLELTMTDGVIKTIEQEKLKISADITYDD